MYLYNLALRFEDIVRRAENDTAVMFSEEETVSYGGLNSAANRAARTIMRSVQEGGVICITGEKRPDTFVMMLACLKLGSPYVMLDPDSPSERLTKIIGRCLPSAVLDYGCGGNIATSAESLGIKRIDIETITSDSQAESPENLDSSRRITGLAPAYIMFTSGSTGFPKGAVMTHANVLNLISWSMDTYRFSKGERLTNVNPLYFDNSVFDFYSAVFNGLTLVPFTKQEASSPMSIVNKVDGMGCTSWFSVPSMLIFLQTMRAFSPKTFQTVKRYIFGGEGYPKARLKALYDMYKDRAEFHNVYGPTECTCICSTYRLADDDFEDLKGFPPLGDMTSNFGFLILDDNEQVVGKDETGELCLLGPNVGRGYYNDPERTAKAFRQNPQIKNYTDIMYKTGDLVSLSSEDGKIRVFGRSDNQIKRMGYRIELEEIENAFCCIDGVHRAAAVFLREAGLSGKICTAVEADFSDGIEDRLREIIPSYMIPDEIEVVTEIPKNVNGKIDRQSVKQYFESKFGA